MPFLRTPKYFVLVFLLILFFDAPAREGMWMPQLLKELNESEMKSMGMEINADDIYSLNHASLKDAIVQFGAGCTGELISSNGLLITNHHCGLSQIQSLSVISKNFLKDGFWAANREDEIPCPGLKCTFIREIVDVTSDVLAGISDTVSEEARAQKIKVKTDSIEKSVNIKLTGVVRQFYQGNKFYLFITEVYNDIRFVGAPPISIGKFGGDTDNWMWPRHTGDFSLFRIYADKDNNPAVYSKENIPYTPKQFLTINIGGLKENDFAFVYGFPGRTNEYLPSSALEVIAKQTNPNRIAIRQVRLDIMKEAMNSNDTIQLQYAARYSTLQNYYKKWQGELLGFKRFDLINEKKIREEEFNEKLKNFPELLKDSILISLYDSFNEKAKPLNFANDYFVEALSAIEIVNASARFKTLISISEDSTNREKKINDEILKLKKDFREFYRNYNPSLDYKICKAVLSISYSNLEKQYIPEKIFMEGQRNDNFKKYCSQIYKNSLLADSAGLMKFLNSFKKNDVKKILNDPAYNLSLSIAENQTKLQANLRKLNSHLSQLQRNYMRDLLIINQTGKLYPDANSSLRVSYGKIESVAVNDGMQYNYFTTADGILDKSKTNNREYKTPQKLSELIKNRDYGRYGSGGILPVAFLSSVHTTNGNSGSPTLNSKGELIGVNYDRIWEGVVSDYYYDEKHGRNISLDIRYALFIIEKFGNAGWLIDEMRIVN